MVKILNKFLSCCIEYNKSFASSQSLWNHKTRCFRSKKEDRSDTTIQSIDKDKIIGDILNKGDQRVKDRTTSSFLTKQELKMDDIVPMQVDPRSYFAIEEKKNSNPELDSGSGSDESEPSDADVLNSLEKLSEICISNFITTLGYSINWC